ncbi:MAG: histidine kinase N-terminal 7TM domain-containing protein [Chloroflexota bacterium]
MAPPNWLLSALLLIAGLTCLVVVAVLWMRTRTAPGAQSLGLMMLALAWWDITYAIFWANAPAPLEYFWLDITMLGAYIVPTAILIFALDFSQTGSQYRRWIILALAIEPALIFILQWTDPWHNLYFGGFRALNTTSLYIAGPAYWFNVYYSYALVLAALVVLVLGYARSGGIYRRQTGLVLAAIIVPWIGNILGVAGMGSELHLDVTPFIFTFTAVLIAAALLRYHLLDIVPIAQSLLLDNMSDGVLVLDLRSRVIEINPVVEHMLGLSSAAVHGLPVEQVFSRWPAMVRRFSSAADGPFDLLIDETAQVYLDMRISALVDPRGRCVGRLAVWRDISAIKRAQKQTADALEFNRTIIHSSPVGILIYRASGECISANSAVERILGLPPEAVLQQSLAQLTAGKLVELYQAAEHAIHTGRPAACQVHGFSASGKEVWLGAICSPYTSAGLPHLLVMFSDDSQRQQAEAALLAAHAELEQRVQERTAELQASNLALGKALGAKDEFLAAVSHELRTPLTGILGLSEVLQLPLYGELNAKQLSAVHNIESSGRRLLALVNDMIDFAQLQSGQFDLHCSPCDPAAVCNDCLQAVSGLAQAKHQRLEYNLGSEAVLLQIDPRRIQQALTNLLDNAIKFTPEQGRIDLRLVFQPEQRLVCISVTDSGIGIHPDDLPRIFQPFVQIDARLARAYNGTGLGLPLVKALVELHGGQVTVESALGRGSCFTIHLPWQETAAVQQP